MITFEIRDNPELTKLLQEAAAEFRALSPEQQQEMMRIQKEGYVRAEMSWPKPNFSWKDGVKVYASYEDYYND